MSLQTLRLPAPAKLNLMLRVIGRRPDGYHLLQTVFQFIDFCDWIALTERDDGRITLARLLPNVPEDSDLTVRAAKLLQQAAGKTGLGVEIDVKKNLPMGGGLGGGSSDAATVLLGLNALWGLGLPIDALAKLGLCLGADVPVFVRGYAAWGEGVGEDLTPLLELPEPWYVVLIPPCQVSTAAIFSAEGLTRDNPPLKIADFIAGQHDNHCLPVVISHYPVIAQAIAGLRAHSESVRLTGTGACVFAEFSTQSAAIEAATGLAKNWQVFVAKGVNLSPVHAILDNFSKRA